VTAGGAAALVAAGVALVLAAAAATWALAERRRSRALVTRLSALLERLRSGDVTEVFAATDDTLPGLLQAQATDLVEANVTRDAAIRRERDAVHRLTGDIAHQLKTPVAQVKLYADLARSSDPPGPYSGELAQAADRLVFLADSLVTLSRLEAGVIAPQPADAPLTPTLLAALGQVSAAAATAGVELKFTEPTPDPTVRHDPKWTAEALANVLDNAVKYTPAGGRVTLGVTPLELYCRIDVADTGIGVDPAEAERLFARFYRGRGSDTRPGAGLGLHLARHVVEAQSGYITARPADQEGSVFSLYLPLAP
jgi:signal transduction histidine kinase